MYTVGGLIYERDRQDSLFIHRFCFDRKMASSIASASEAAGEIAENLVQENVVQESLF